MKFFAFERKQFSADYYDYTTTTDSEGGTLYFYTFVRRINFFANNDGVGRLSIKFGPENYDVRNMSHLRNLKDSDGLEMVPGAIWTVASLTGSYNVGGKKESQSGIATWEYSTSAG